MSRAFLVWLEASRRKDARVVKQYKYNIPAGII